MEGVEGATDVLVGSGGQKPAGKRNRAICGHTQTVVAMYVIFGYFLVEIRPNPVDPHPISLVMAVFELNSTFLNYWELWGGHEGLFVTIFSGSRRADFVVFTGDDMHPPQTPERFSKPTKRLYKHVLDPYTAYRRVKGFKLGDNW